ncbi:MAG: rRNA pseudouridine synthase [Bacteroidia bacterium]|nr:rRNA pseudouridine synthase [Bacteroidia bacterium]
MKKTPKQQAGKKLKKKSFLKNPSKKIPPGKFAKPSSGKPNNATKNDDLIRLNRYLSMAGICSRREADEYIKAGLVKVNGKVVDELGVKVKKTDKVTFNDKLITPEKKIYILLNKPKGYITTRNDEKGRKTVMDLVAHLATERVYPVGRLDRNTTGLLLFTNDGELARKLTHPSSKVEKIYHAELDKNLKSSDLALLRDEGIELDDGHFCPDDIAYDGPTKKCVGIKIHSGRNRIVRRMFEALGYSVLKLDRVVFAGLTKKNLPRGRARLLTEKEIAFLKMI